MKNRHSANYWVKGKGTLHIASTPTVKKAKALAERRIRQAPSVDEALEAQVKESAARARAGLVKFKARKRG